MKKNKPIKKVFVSQDSDRGILIKFSKDKKKISLSFWGNDDPKNISFSKEDGTEFCRYILENLKESDDGVENSFELAWKNMNNILPKTHL